MIEYESYLTGVTGATAEHLQLDAGVFLKSYTPGSDIVAANIISATRGGGTLDIVPVTHHVDADGIPQNFVGMDRIDEYTVNMNTTLIEVTEDTLTLAFGGAVNVASITRTGTSIVDKKITLKNVFQDSDYTDIWWLGNLSDGTKIAVKLSKTRCKDGLRLTINNKGEGTFPINLTAHYNFTYSSSQTPTITGIQTDAPVEIWFVKNAA